MCKIVQNIYHFQQIATLKIYRFHPFCEVYTKDEISYNVISKKSMIAHYGVNTFAVKIIGGN